jgi:hypothetical protein
LVGKKHVVKKQSTGKNNMYIYSVADPDPNPYPPDPHVFGPPGSGSISQMYESGSVSGSEFFCQQAKL